MPDKGDIFSSGMRRNFSKITNDISFVAKRNQERGGMKSEEKRSGAPLHLALVFTVFLGTLLVIFWASFFDSLYVYYTLYNTEDIYTNIYCFCFVNVNSGWLWKWLVSLFERWPTAGNPRLKVVEQASGNFSLFENCCLLESPSKQKIIITFLHETFIWGCVKESVWTFREPCHERFRHSLLWFSLSPHITYKCINAKKSIISWSVPMLLFASLNQFKSN